MDEAEQREQLLLDKVDALENRLQQLEGGLKQVLDSQQQLTAQQRLLLERLDDSPHERSDRH